MINKQSDAYYAQRDLRGRAIYFMIDRAHELYVEEKKELCREILAIANEAHKSFFGVELSRPKWYEAS